MDLELFSEGIAVQQGIVKTDGSITLSLGGPETGQIWLLDHLTVQCTSLTVPYVTVYVASSPNLLGPDTVIDYTDSGNNDVSEYPQAQYVPENQELFVVWQGCSQTGAAKITPTLAVIAPQATVAYARATYRVMETHYS